MIEWVWWLCVRMSTAKNETEVKQTWTISYRKLQYLFFSQSHRIKSTSIFLNLFYAIACDIQSTCNYCDTCFARTLATLCVFYVACAMHLLLNTHLRIAQNFNGAFLNRSIEIKMHEKKCWPILNLMYRLECWPPPWSHFSFHFSYRFHGNNYKITFFGCANAHCKNCKLLS